MHALRNLLLNTDSYKASHWLQYPPGTDATFFYVESRGGIHDRTVFFGLQAILKEYLATPVTHTDVDEAREYVLEDLLEAGRVESAGYVDGVGACTAAAPRRNLTGDPYFTDGNRIAIVVSAARTTPRFVAWQ